MKLTLDEISQALKTVGINPDQHDKVVQELNKIAEENKADRESSKLPKAKNEFGVILYDAENVLAGKEFTASIYLVANNFDHNTVLSKLSEAARSQNEQSKKKKNVITTMGEVFEGLKRKFSKEKGITLKNKIPARVIVSSNRLI